MKIGSGIDERVAKPNSIREPQIEGIVCTGGEFRREGGSVADGNVAGAEPRPVMAEQKDGAEDHREIGRNGEPAGDRVDCRHLHGARIGNR